VKTNDVPYFRPDITDAEVDHVVAAIRSCWLIAPSNVQA
jgi:hypothetical protein